MLKGLSLSLSLSLSVSLSLSHFLSFSHACMNAVSVASDCEFYLSFICVFFVVCDLLVDELEKLTR